MLNLVSQISSYYLERYFQLNTEFFGANALNEKSSKLGSKNWCIAGIFFSPSPTFDFVCLSTCNDGGDDGGEDDDDGVRFDRGGEKCWMIEPLPTPQQSIEKQQAPRYSQKVLSFSSRGHWGRITHLHIWVWWTQEKVGRRIGRGRRNGTKQFRIERETWNNGKQVSSDWFGLVQQPPRRAVTNWSR